MQHEVNNCLTLTFRCWRREMSFSFGGTERRMKKQSTVWGWILFFSCDCIHLFRLVYSCIFCQTASELLELLFVLDFRWELYLRFVFKMPLPPALAAKLSKRGLINPKAQRTNDDPGMFFCAKFLLIGSFSTIILFLFLSEEEVFAEDYDESFTTQAVTGLSMRLTPCPLCPNKYNLHHDCTQYCWMHWVEPVRPDPTFERRRKNMLKKYPISEGWKEQLDPGTWVFWKKVEIILFSYSDCYVFSGRYYYYEESSGKVSWMSPSYPKASISEPAAVLREKIKAQPIAKAPVLYKPGEEPEEEKVFSHS